MTYTTYRNQELYCEDVPVRELAEEYGTPLYVYSKSEMIESYRSIDSAFGDYPHLVCYALKANANAAILKLFSGENAGADVVSAGELYLALKAGFAPDKIVFAGVGKREDEIEYALQQNIFAFNAESVSELQAISRAALRLNTTARVSLRINPDIDAESHPYITTGLHSNKFGIESSKAIEVYRYAKSLPSITLTGIHTHIGSQITKVEPFVATAQFIVRLLDQLREAGIHLTHIDFGGGVGVKYVNAIRNEALPAEDGVQDSQPAAADVIRAVLPVLQPSGCSIWVEPGRALVAEAGMLVTRVIYLKENGAKKFFVVDAAMTDLLRPSLYQAYHQIVPTLLDTYERVRADVVGPVCESGDFLARDRMLPKVKQNDVLAVLTAGAYGFVTASHYNGRPRPAEVLVNGERVRLIRPRETFEHLL